MGGQKIENPFEAAYQAEQPRALARSAPAKLVANRMAALPYRVNVGEQVVGSDHAFDLGTVQILDGFAGEGVVFGSVSAPQLHADLATDANERPSALGTARAQSFAVETGPNYTPYELRTDKPDSVRIRFAPSAAGSYEAEVAIRIVWSDGNWSEQTVVVEGTARWPDDVPHPSQIDPSSPSRRDIDGIGDVPGKSASIAVPEGSTLDDAAAAADANLLTLSRAQDAGIALAENEAAAYDRAPEKPGWWAVLADLAISMGVAAIADVISKTLAARVIGTKDPELLKKSKVYSLLSAGFKEGTKNQLKHAVPTIANASPARETLPGTAADEKRAAAAGAFSSNPMIDFWATQRSGLIDADKDRRAAVVEAKATLRNESPQVAVQAMSLLGDVLAASDTVAEVTRSQAFASETQWMSGIAQSAFGESTVAVGTEMRDTTELRYARANTQFNKPDGLLKIAVTLPPGADPISATVTGASITGISQEIADRVWRYPLLAVSVPVMLDVRHGSQQVRVTRDEAGRVRVDGILLVGDVSATDPEAQMLAGGTQLCAVVLAQSLRAWGLMEIKTDDGTGREK